MEVLLLLCGKKVAVVGTLACMLMAVALLAMTQQET
jgi:hypothetical protein